MTHTGFFQHTDSRLDDRLRAPFVTVFRNESGNPLLWGNTTKEKKGNGNNQWRKGFKQVVRGRFSTGLYYCVTK